MEPIIAFVTDPDDDELRDIRLLYEEQGWLDATDDREAIRRIIKGSHCFAVARMEGRIVGMGRAISDKTSDAYVQDVTVKKEFRNENLGSLIIRTIVARLRSDRVGWIALVAEQGSGPFYERLGFLPMEDCAAMKYAGK